MKKIYILCLLMPLLAVQWSCKKDKLTEFNIDYSTSLPVPAASYTANVPADFTTPEISTESASKFKDSKTSQELISEIKLTKFNVSTSSGNLDGLKSMSIYLKSSGMSDVLVATKSDIPSGVSSTSADLSDVNIKDHIFKDKIQFRVTLTLSTGSGAAQQYKMDQTLHVKAKLIN